MATEAGHKKRRSCKDKIDWDVVKGCAEIMCTQEEIMHVSGHTIDTLNKYAKEKYGCSINDKIAEWQSGGKRSLRRHQFNLAVKNPTMGIWLGKQWLGQKEPKEEALENMSFADLAQALIDHGKRGQARHDTLKQSGKIEELVQDN